MSTRPPEKPGSGFSAWIVSGIVVLIGASLYGGYSYLTPESGPDRGSESELAEPLLRVPVEDSEKKSDASPRPALRSEYEQQLGPDVAESEATDKPEEAPKESAAAQALPAPGESDGFARDLLAGLSDRPEYARWIGMKHLVPKFVMLVDNLSKGAVPAARFRELAPEETFSAIAKTPEQYSLDPRGYHRYDRYADTLSSLDVDAAFRVYRMLKPLFDTAYQDLGYPDGDFDAVLRKAIGHLLATPRLSGEILLVRPSVMYRFADPDLESLSKAQKQLIRMGPRNTRIIQSTLKAFLANLDRPSADTVQRDSHEP